MPRTGNARNWLSAPARFSSTASPRSVSGFFVPVPANFDRLFDLVLHAFSATPFNSVKLHKGRFIVAAPSLPDLLFVAPRSPLSADQGPSVTYGVRRRHCHLSRPVNNYA